MALSIGCLGNLANRIVSSQSVQAYFFFHFYGQNGRCGINEAGVADFESSFHAAQAMLLVAHFLALSCLQPILTFQPTSNGQYRLKKCCIKFACDTNANAVW